MKRPTLHKPALTGAAALLAATLACGSLAAAATEPDGPRSEPFSATPAFGPASRADVSVYFQDFGIALPAAPVIVNERMMVPGAALLQGLGYETTWDAGAGKLTAAKDGKTAFVFEADRSEAEIGSAAAKDLPASPFVREDALWIPLRATLEALGMKVDWDPMNRMAVVKDPLALPKFSVAAMAADQSLAGQPAKLEAALKTALQANASIDLISPERYRDKINLMIAAGDLKSLMLIPNIGQFPDSLIPSIAMDLTDLLDDYPRLKALASQSEQGFAPDGRIYGIPLPQDPHDAPFPAVRQDWLNVLNLAQPKTMDEMFQVLKQFTEYDPDGNGKHDTYGMTGYTTAAGLGSFAWVEQAYTGSPGRFSVKDGQVVDHAVGEQEAAALQWLARAYEEGLIDKEFALLTSEQAADRVRDNHSGVAALSLSEAAALSADGPTAWTPLSGLKADTLSASIAPWSSQDAGTYIVTKMSKVDPKIILTWLERGIEMTEKGEWEQAGSPESPLTTSDRSALRSLFGSSDLLKDIGSMQNLTDTDRTAYETAVKEWRNTSYEGIAVPGIDSLWSKGQHAELNSKLEQFKIKVIMGAASIKDWNDYVQEMASSDEYKMMIAELNELVAE